VPRWQTVVALSGLLFASAGGRRHSVNATRSLHWTLRRSGLRRRFHDLRHMSAALAIEAGEDIATV